MGDTITIGVDGWCQQSHVRRSIAQHATRLGDGQGPIDDDDIAEWILDRARIMEGALAQTGITLANLVADATATAVLRRINAVGAAIDVVKALFRGATDVPLDTLVSSDERDWERELKRLRANYYKLGSVDSTAESTVRLNTDLRSGGDDETPDVELDTDFG